MLKNAFFSLAVIFYSLVYPPSFATELEEVSIYSPNRFGFNSSIVNIPLEGVDDGPKDRNFYLAPRPGVPAVTKSTMKFDEEYQYVYEEKGEQGPYEIPFESYLQPLIKNRISTYGIARLTFDSFQDCCRKININHLNNLQVKLNPDDQICALGIRNAYYERTDQHGIGNIQLCSQADKIQPLPVAKFFDIVSHETGHSILDALNGTFYGHASNSPSAAFHEAFGDLSVFFASVRLARFTSDKSHLNEFTSTLKDKDLNFCLAFGLDESGHCLRNSRDLAASCEAHDTSTNFTNFYLTSMSNVFRTYSLTKGNALWVADFFQTLLIKSIVSINRFDSLYDIGAHIIDQVPTLNDPLLAEPGTDHIQQILRTNLEAHLVNLTACNSNQAPPPSTPSPVFGLRRILPTTNMNINNNQLPNRFNDMRLNEYTDTERSFNPRASYNNPYPTFESFLLEGKMVSYTDIQCIIRQGIGLEEKYWLDYEEWRKHFS